MKIDYTDFIVKHHKKMQPGNGSALQKKRYGGVFSIIIVSLMVLVIFLAETFVYHSEHSRFMSLVALVSTAALVFVALRSFRIHRRQSREMDLMSAVLEGSRAARMITDGADNIIYYNRKFEQLCRGVGAPNYATLIRLFQNNDEALSHFNVLADKAHRGLTDSIELFSKFEDRERWLMVTAQPVSGYAGYIHWRIDDVTQKYTIDRAIRQEREKLIDFTDNAPVGFFSVNEHGRFIFANATFARWVGEDINVLLDRGYLHTYLEEPPKDARPFDLMEEPRPRQIVEIRMKGAAGKTFLASINQVIVEDPKNKQVRTRAVVYDLTTEREMRRALQASEDRFQRFFEEAPLGIVLIDNQGVIEDCNSTFSYVLKTDVDRIEGQKLEDFIHDNDRNVVLAALSRIEDGGQMGAPLEISLNVGAKTVQTQMHARRFKESESTVLHFIDVTEQKSLEAQFVQSQKMQAIGQLAGGVAHDFNNLLTAIIGFCDLLLLRHKPGDPSFADIMQIKQNSNRAANLVRQLLAFSRQQTLRPRVQDVTDILTEVSHLLRRLIGANIELDLVHGDDLALVKVDEGQMEQVLINLAVNARDAMNEAGSGGVLTIETENYTNRKPRELASEELPAGHWITIKVQDSGCGIPQENMTRIFEPFFTTKEVGAGTGLGLATVYGIIRQTGGYLDVMSVVDEGTSFTIYLPRAHEVEEEDEDVAPLENDNKDLTGTERIMLVEDEDAVRTFSERALVNKGYEVLSAESGEAGVALIESQENKNLDLLITDVVMPGIDGPTMANQIREHSPNLKIIFMSGYTEDKLKDHMGENIWFLPKPFTLKQLAAKVKEVLED